MALVSLAGVLGRRVGCRAKPCRVRARRCGRADAERAKVPAAKSVPVRIVREEAAHELRESPLGMVPGHLLSDSGRDVIRLGVLALNAAKAQRVKAARVALAVDIAAGLLARSRGRRPRR
jgi:hypothetical protein